MAKVKSGIKVDTKRKIVTVYTNVRQTASDKKFIDIYVANGYTLAEAKKPYSPRTKEMDKNIDKYADEKIKEEYQSAKDDTDFFGACSIYSKWEKDFFKSLKKQAKDIPTVSEKRLTEIYKYSGIIKAIEYIEEKKENN